MGNTPACIKASQKLRLILKDELPPSLKIINLEDSYCFRIEGFRGKYFNLLSVSYPPDAMGNRTEDQNEYPETIETAIFKDNEIVYIEEFGYEDVKRFYNVEDLLKEIYELHYGINYDDKIKIIQRNWKEAVSNPEFKLCQKIQLNNMVELGALSKEDVEKFLQKD